MNGEKDKTEYSEGRCKRDVKGREQDRRRTDWRELIEKGVPLTIDYSMMSIVPFTTKCLCGSTMWKNKVGEEGDLGVRKGKSKKETGKTRAKARGK